MSLIRIVGSIAAVGAARGIGLVLAILVSVLLAGTLGAGAATDAFFFSRRLTYGLAEALGRVVNMVLVPNLVAALRSKSAEEISRIWRSKLVKIVGISLAGAILLALAAPLVVSVLAPGLDDDGARLAAYLIRIMAFILPAGLFVAAGRSLLNAGRRFAVPAALSMTPRVFVICTLLLLIPPMGVSKLAWAMLFGMLFAGLILFIYIVRSVPAMRVEGGEAGDEPQREVSGRLWPSILNHGYGQAIIWIDLAFASLTAVGGLSVLEYGSRLMAVFPSLLTTSLITVMYTEYSHRSLDKTDRALQRSIVRTARGGLFLLLPMAGLIALLSDDVVELLLLRGAFDAEAAMLTAQVMKLVAPATVLSFLVNNLISGLYADSTAPRMKIMSRTVTVALACRVIAIYLLLGPLGIAGVPLGGSIAALIMLLVFYFQLRRHWGRFLDKSDARSAARISAAVAGSLLLVHLLRAWIGFEPAGTLGRIGALVGYAAIGGMCYLGLVVVLRVKEVSDVRELLARKR